MINPVVDLGIPESVGGMQNIQSLGRINAVLMARKARFYHGKLDHIDIDRASEPDEWAKIPILDVATLGAMGNDDFLDQFCIAQRKDIVEYWRGHDTRLLYPRTSRDQRYGVVGAKRALALAGFDQDDMAHLSLAMGLDPTGHLIAQGAAEIGIGMVSAGAENAVSQLDLIRGLRPSAWIGKASTGIELGQSAADQKDDLAKGSLRKILCTGEALPDDKRRKLSEQWGAEVRDCLAISEAMVLGCEDSDCYGFRFWSDYCYPEVLDPQTLEQVEEGVSGLLVITPLVTNHAAPLLRLNTGKTVTMRSGRRLRSAFDIFPVIQFVD